MQQEPIVDLNVQVQLVKRPTADYPLKEDVFQVKYVPPIPTDLVKEGQIVIRNLFLSIDATMRVWISGARSYMEPIKPGDVMKGMGVGEVIFSKDAKFQVGDRVLALTYWQKYSVIDTKGVTKLPKNYEKPEHFLGVLGISGLTAYFGLKQIGKLKQGETVVISTAAGAVGEIAVQLAKNWGCTVVGIAGSPQKCNFVRSLGADFVIDYKTESIKAKLKQYLPGGVDVYFDNVGGEILDDVLMHIRDQSRIIACGSISSYGQLNGGQPYRLKNYSRIIIKRATIQGFLYFDYAKQFPAAILELQSLIKANKLHSTFDYLNGVQSCPQGLRRLLLGQNTGKVMIRVNNDLSPSL